MGDLPVRRAAQYVRMSTEHQNYSIEYQSAANAAYAAEHGCEIVRTYADEGISGLTLERRPGLKALLADVLAGGAGFEVVLTYDVSRWGRFQDVDEAAHYEFICRTAGVALEYTAESFRNDGSLVSTLMKQVRRVMAAEYSRDLSAKVSRAKLGLSLKGYWTGGPAPFGLRRCVVATDGTPRGILEAHEHNALLGYRTILVRGPEAEVETVQLIFRMFVVWGLSIPSITTRLNGDPKRRIPGREWTEWRVRHILKDEGYIGVLVIMKRPSVLKRPKLQPREKWLRVPGACPALVSRGLFELAQFNMLPLNQRGDEEALLDDLRDLWARRGRLSQKVIAEDPSVKSANTYARRFGSVERALALIGYQPTPLQQAQAERIRKAKPYQRRNYASQISDEEALQKVRTLLETHGKIDSELIGRAPGVPCPGFYRKRFGSLRRVYALIGYTPRPSQYLRFKPGALLR